MASMIRHPLLCLALLPLLSQLAHSALIPKPKNLTDHKHRASNTYIVHADHLAKPPHFATLGHWYTSMVATHSPRSVADDSSRVLHTYDTVMHGFAVQLTGEEARRMAAAVGVIGVYEDRPLRLLTTRSPGFLGLDPRFGAWRGTDSGDGVIIGIVDTGIWPESPSFSDSGLGPVRSSWRGKCVGSGDFNASLLCNNKLVGARASDVAGRGGSSVPSPMDYDGHGTHVASTAAGSEVRDAGILMFARGTARGVAPKAKLAIYKVTSVTSDSVAAIDAAVKDGVDIISGSIGICDAADACPFYDDALAVATCGAERAGVFVALSGGNDGPEASTVTNAAPWVTTVGASTGDRRFPAKLNLGDGTVLTGQSLYTLKADGTTMFPLVFSSCSVKALTPDQIMGKIVVCVQSDDDDDNQGVDEAEIMRRAGAAGLVMLGPDDDCEEAPLPALTLSHAAWEKLRAYMSSAQDPMASFDFACETAIADNRAPMVWSSSSRGPNRVAAELLKPDVIAPGVQILAAWTGANSPTNSRNNNYEFDSGTSMACPHVAGVAALIKRKHSGWTPAMIRSALVTTAGTLDNTDREILDNGDIDRDGNAKAATPFAVGAGHVRPQLAMDPGLVYDASARDLVDFLCALNYTAQQLRRFAPDLATCSRELPGGPADLNYPSLVVVFDGRASVRTLTRTVTKVSEEAETYKVTVVASEHVNVTVTPATLDFKKQYEKRSYTVEFRSEAGANPKAGWEFGHIIWENEKHQVRSPVAFMWKTNN
ncbi:subtilisin-like protease SBT1.7 [Panicum miliaceum]|uniref:Subtilisin-like protease SBT1.7 n=1 Tax=Panicum miliaceum TaxID=4540 RepID=A0A3L6TAY3_PANMI|nr:subtilisin-like protease SBT1.7 [Panicum miliaceum]